MSTDESVGLLWMDVVDGPASSSNIERVTPSAESADSLTAFAQAFQMVCCSVR